MTYIAKSLLVFSIAFASCVQPRAIFSVHHKIAQAPTLLSVINQSKNFDTCYWAVNGQPVSVNSEGKILVTHTGNSDVILYAKMGEKVDSFIQKVQLSPPTNNCLVEIQTNFGTMVAELSSLTPHHADRFESLVESGYYDSLPFHRIIPGFVVQGGDGTLVNRVVPTDLNEELLPEIRRELLHYRGALAAARAPDEMNPDRRSSISQFYIVHGRRISQIGLKEMADEGGIEYTSIEKANYVKKRWCSSIRW